MRKNVLKREKRAVCLLSVDLYSSLRTGASTFGMGHVGRNRTPSLNIVWSRALQRYRFFSVLAAIIREISDKQLVLLRIVKALLFIHQPDRVSPKASDVSAADWLTAVATHVKKYDIFSRVLLRLFLGPGIPV